MKKLFIPIFSVSLFLAAWEIASRGGFLNPALCPPPSKVFIAFLGMLRNGTVAEDLRASIWRTAAGAILGITIGVSVGLLSGRLKLWRQFVSPLIHIFRPLPPVALIPLMIVWFGIGDGAKIIMIALAVFFPVWIATHVGAERISSNYLHSAALLTKSRFKLFTHIIFPATLAHSTVGIRTGIAIAFIMTFVAELAGASSGLGYRISITQSAYRLDQTIAALLLLGALGALADQLCVRGIKRLFPWLNPANYVASPS